MAVTKSPALAEDTLSIRTSGGITTAGGTASFNGNAFATFSTDINGDLQVAFTTADATPAAVQALIQAIDFANTLENPTGGARAVTFTLSDGAASTAPSKNVIVTPVNDAPMFMGAAAINYQENDAATMIAAAATVTDVDSPDFNGGSLSFALAPVFAEDQLTIETGGGITTAGANVSFGGNVIGTFTGGNGATLTISFNSWPSRRGESKPTHNSQRRGGYACSRSERRWLGRLDCQ